jgi:hypothetical protein
VLGRRQVPAHDAAAEREVPGLSADGRRNWKIDREPRISDAAANVLSRVGCACKTSKNRHEAAAWALQKPPFR